MENTVFIFHIKGIELLLKMGRLPYEQKQISDAAIASTADDINRLRSTIADQKRLLKKTAPPVELMATVAPAGSYSMKLSEDIKRWQEMLTSSSNASE